ncbi:glycoside hydrolase family 1 protein [Lacticaseibacillus chiayiensis]|uniref:glycoside hydrolase family 1 protein n=1 Tax=Lacticaseibacillus chiayiensis TaxID=2100821 RepID=UPI001BCC2DF9|nr:glycoside hydrolase family 1 protein [Lacticaseibacillus chiayiensis]QVI34570.1 glycoside hydrolase family 1 protein [Lacticaseibacillus chiayiensis]
MSQPLPRGFLWGNSTSSMQTEGGWDEGGKGRSVYDIRSATNNSSDWRVAIDEYHRYDEDIDLMANQGMNCYRFQISWSRVCPTGDGDFNEEGIQFYDNLINKLLDHNMTPMICLYHFDMPLALAEKYNGFIDRHVVDAFVRFGKEMINRFADKVPYWITFNEQNLYSMSEVFRISGYLKGSQSDADLYRISHHVMVAHAKVANYLHDHTHAKIGGMLAYQEVYPATSRPRDILYARRIDEFLNRNLLDVFVHGRYSSEVFAFLKNHHIDLDLTEEDQKAFEQLHSDFIAFSYYRSLQISSDHVPIGIIPNRYLDFGAGEVPGLPVNEWGWNIDPMGFRGILTKTYNQYHLPMFPIENGIGMREQYNGSMIQDDYRIDYHRQHIQALKKAVFEDGVDVIGYLGWGLIDIPSSSGNMDKRYGMVYVNRTNHDLKDLKRIPKKSYGWFKHVIKTNGADLDQ